MENELLKQAFDRLTIPDIAVKLNMGLPPLKIGLQKSPFRKDDKPSFSIFAKGQRFKDQATGKGGATWHFVEMAQPGWNKREIAEFLIRSAGLDPATEKPSKASMKRFRAEVKQRERAERKRRIEEWIEPVPVPRWAASVEAAYLEGWKYLKVSPDKQRKLARDRGWPVSIVEALLKVGLIAKPWLPWARPGEAKARRGIAFVVQQPGAIEGHISSGLELCPIGYHQRYKSKTGENLWAFVPYKPNHPEGGNLSEYQKTLAALGRKIEPLPFVLGEIQQPRGVVILEGQWDAATFFEAYGGFAANPLGLAVFGIRGSKGTEVFLSHYGQWLRYHRPPVLLIPDLDEAGQAWAHRSRPHEVTFFERLQGLGASRVAVEILKRPEGCGEKEFKDFNDFFRKYRPGPEVIAGLFAKISFPAAPGHATTQAKKTESAEPVIDEVFAKY